MAYRRVGEQGSRVYLYATGRPLALVCHDCELVYLGLWPGTDSGEFYSFGHGKPTVHFAASSTAEMVHHLQRHLGEWQWVPDFDDLVAELTADDAENYPVKPA
jgi:hypothetical protein